MFHQLDLLVHLLGYVLHWLMLVVLALLLAELGAQYPLLPYHL